MDLHFKKLGSGKQTLVILHGLFGSLDNWMTLGRQFAETHTVYLIDQRNHGRSPHSEDFSYEWMAQDLGAFLEKENIQNPILMGHSMGGKTVMQLAVNNPDSFSKLIVVDMSPRQYPVHHQQILDGLNALDLSKVERRGEALGGTLFPYSTALNFILSFVLVGLRVYVRYVRYTQHPPIKGIPQSASGNLL